MNTSTGLIVVFAKQPREGEVKTRLARTIGARAATELAAAFLEDACALASSTGQRVVVAWDGDAEQAPKGLTVWPQGDGDLGERLERAFRHGLQLAPWMIALGADSPGLPRGHLMAAAAALGASRDGAVIGPARDGGFYLVGFTRLPTGVFDGVRWSTPRAGADMIGSISRAAFALASLPTYFDVDDAEDLLELRQQIGEDAGCAPATAAALARLGPLV